MESTLKDLKTYNLKNLKPVFVSVTKMGVLENTDTRLRVFMTVSGGISKDVIRSFLFA